MRISFSPQCRDDSLSVEVTGKRIRINGELFNFNSLNDGDTIDAANIPCEWIVGQVGCEDGDIQITLVLPHGVAPSHALAFPEPITVTVDGPVDIPSDPPPASPVEVIPEEEEETDVDA